MVNDGILNINKPAGVTSFHVVALIRRWSRVKKVGHAGTLDPSATGVLPVCLGRATKTVSLFMEFTKTYQVKIELGVATDTFDASGRVLRRADTSFVTRGEVETALANFKGEIWQRPPPFSAIKVSGKPLYKLARAGIAVEPSPRKVSVYHLEILDYQLPYLTLEVVCGRGMYVRSIAHDLGEALGCGGIAMETIRTRYGLFKLAEAVTLPQLEEAFHSGNWTSLLYPINKILIAPASETKYGKQRIFPFG